MSFRYEGVATTLKFTVSCADKAEMYLHGINVANEPEQTEVPELVGNGKADVWDFGAAKLDEADYNNTVSYTHLDVYKRQIEQLWMDTSEKGIELTVNNIVRIVNQIGPDDERLNEAFKKIDHEKGQDRCV